MTDKPLKIGPAPLAIVNRLTSDLHPDPRNPRQHSKGQVEAIARSIDRFGFNVPILIDAEGKVIAGHGRLMAARLRGIGQVPTISLEHLTPAQIKAFMIADNKLVETSHWDKELLAEQIQEIADTQIELLEATGFSLPEIDVILDEVGQSAESDPADALPAVTTRPTIAKPGDLFILGRHRLLCGDALEADSYKSVLDGALAEMVITDPPYNVRIEGHASGNGSIHHRDFVMASGEMSEAEFESFLTTVCKNLGSASRDGALHYICMDWRHLEPLLKAGRSAYSELKNTCVWVKSNAGMGSLYRSQHEMVLVFKHGQAKHRNNVELGKHGRNRTNVWNYPCISTLGRNSEEGYLLGLHPTVKPVALLADAILDASARDSIVLDAFTGSGSTLIAAERTGRRFCGLELDPGYVDTAIRRWQKYAGEKARHAETGECFDDLADKGAGDGK